MEKKNIDLLIKTLLVDISGIDINEIEDSSKLKADLGLDSMELLDLQVSLKGEYKQIDDAA